MTTLKGRDEMRSAIYYPSTQVHSKAIMKSSLLLWDQLHTIVPMPHYAPDYSGRDDMAEAWELIGSPIVPGVAQKQRAHDAIETTVKSGTLPPHLYEIGQIDSPEEYYEVWPQKFSVDTWGLLLAHGLSGVPLPNGDYPFTQEGGLLVMAKLADACAGTQFARVTDRLMAYGMIGSGDQQQGQASEVVPITLDLIDAASIPISKLIALREREAKEARGHDYRKMRHDYADMVQAHAAALGAALDQFERDELNRQFRDRMETELKDLREALRFNFLDLALKPVVATTVVAAGSIWAGADPGLVIANAAATAIGTSLKDISGSISEFIGQTFNFDQKQREAMANNPMAYMYALSKVH
jgi:hypothetical protein